MILPPPNSFLASFRWYYFFKFYSLCLNINDIVLIFHCFCLIWSFFGVLFLLLFFEFPFFLLFAWFFVMSRIIFLSNLQLCGVVSYFSFRPAGSRFLAGWARAYLFSIFLLSFCVWFWQRLLFDRLHCLCNYPSWRLFIFVNLNVLILASCEFPVGVHDLWIISVHNRIVFLVRLLASHFVVQ